MHLSKSTVLCILMFLFMISLIIDQYFLFYSSTNEYIRKIVNGVEVKQFCEFPPKHLKGHIKPNLTKLNFDEVSEALSSQRIQNGGSWQPSGCVAKYRVAILIPYRNRLEHLKSFLLNMHPIFARQELDYKIYVIEPVANITFNRGLLFNVGFIESNKEYNWDCHVYHDVDLLSEYDGTLFTCPEQPTHLAHFQSKWNYKPVYPTYFGGATIMKREHFQKANGYSNMYFGWGSEDRDHYFRIISRKMKIINPDKLPIGKYYMFKHKRIDINPIRKNIIEASGIKQYNKEGLNSVQYKVVSTVTTSLYTKLIIYYDEKKLLEQLPESLRKG